MMAWSQCFHAWWHFMITVNMVILNCDDDCNNGSILFFSFSRLWTKTLVTTVLWCIVWSSPLLLVKTPETAKMALSSSRTAAWWKRQSCTATWGGRILSLRWLLRTTTGKDTAARRRLWCVHFYSWHCWQVYSDVQHFLLKLNFNFHLCKEIYVAPGLTFKLIKIWPWNFFQIVKMLKYNWLGNLIFLIKPAKV